MRKIARCISAYLIFGLLYSSNAYACAGCFITPSSSRFNFIGYLFWVSVFYWIVMVINESIFKLTKKSLPYESPKIGWKILILCIVLVPFTLGLSLIILPIFSCLIQAAKLISNKTKYFKTDIYLRTLILFQWTILVTFVLVFIFKPNLHAITKPFTFLPLH